MPSLPVIARSAAEAACADLGYPDQRQHAAWRKMSSSEKYALFASHMVFLRELKAAGVRAAHPDWDERRIETNVARIYLHGQS